MWMQFTMNAAVAVFWGCLQTINTIRPRVRTVTETQTKLHHCSACRESPAREMRRLRMTDKKTEVDREPDAVKMFKHLKQYIYNVSFTHRRKPLKCRRFLKCARWLVEEENRVLLIWTALFCWTVIHLWALLGIYKDSPLIRPDGPMRSFRDSQHGLTRPTCSRTIDTTGIVLWYYCDTTVIRLW